MVTESVIVLTPGVPPPDENPAYSDSTGLVTPIAAPDGDEPDFIQLFEVDEGPIVPEGNTILTWTFSGKSGAICEYRIPRPVTQTCYQNLPPSGSMSLAVPDEARQTVQYTLHVEGNEEVASKTVTIPVTVGLDCAYTWFFFTPMSL